MAMHCRRCKALKLTAFCRAREDGLCNWCLRMGDEDDRLRAIKVCQLTKPQAKEEEQSDE